MPLWSTVNIGASTEFWLGFISQWAQCVPELPVVISPVPELIILGKDILSH